MYPFSFTRFLTVRLGDTLKLILLLDGERVRRALGGVNQFISKAFSNALHVAESRLTRTGRDEGNRLVHTTQGRHIDGLTADSALRTNTSRVLTGTRVDDGIHEDLDGVGVGKEVNNLKGVRHNTDSHELLTVVTAVEHEGVHKALNDRHLGLAELLGGVATSRVGGVDGVTERDVVRQRDVLDLDILSAVWLA